MQRSKKTYIVVGHGKENRYLRLCLPPELATLIGESFWIEWEEDDPDKVVLRRVRKD